MGKVVRQRTRGYGFRALERVHFAVRVSLTLLPIIKRREDCASATIALLVTVVLRFVGVTCSQVA